MEGGLAREVARLQKVLGIGRVMASDVHVSVPAKFMTPAPTHCMPSDFEARAAGEPNCF